MKLIAGLGNPGREYAETPHNVGFRAVDTLAETAGATWKIEPQFKADCAKTTLGGEAVLLVKPTTYMNNSGEALASLMHYFRIAPEALVVITDDVHLPPGRIRVRTEGSAGGHNGLKSIIAHLGTQQFTRVRIGVGEPKHGSQDLINHVLGPISAESSTPISQGIQAAAQATQCWLSQGASAAMNQFNAPTSSQLPQDNQKE